LKRFLGKVGVENQNRKKRCTQEAEKTWKEVYCFIQSVMGGKEKETQGGGAIIFVKGKTKN